ncbi:hypothetical protein TRFO_41151 [Tritrichomonas foetus]|uniref:Protein kinase domain-containing protein n=1 Tax=Tritrichomonas foetus TaxID=1144522 RepID=A0A1J4L2G6_9EUKA|nr:hypothetical protein TRFO_41151 [Tritrichomonas foetus]|eukprot:OHT17280.1 hypothetical protein TRFO_41151 [Tritrichomonas foetus]
MFPSPDQRVPSQPDPFHRNSYPFPNSPKHFNGLTSSSFANCQCPSSVPAGSHSITPNLYNPTKSTHSINCPHTPTPLNPLGQSSETIANYSKTYSYQHYPQNTAINEPNCCHNQFNGQFTQPCSQYEDQNIIQSNSFQNNQFENCENEIINNDYMEEECPENENSDISDIIQVPQTVGKYQILNKIGSGTFAEVRLAYNPEKRLKLCVKIVPKAGLTSETEREHQKREIKTLAEIDHPNIVHFFEFSEDANNYYIFMEYLPGRSLLDLVNDNSGIANSLALYIFKQFITALCYLHSIGIAHRDLKLENIIVDDIYHVKIIDFGFCSAHPQEHQQNNRKNLLLTFCGSLLYTSPEIIKAEPYDGYASDMWSGGVILYSMVHGCLPWDDMNIPKAIDQILNAQFVIDDSINPLCANLMKRLLCVDPKERLTAEEALKHPWINGGQRKDTSKTVIVKSSFSTLSSPTSLKTRLFFTGASLSKNERKVEWGGNFKSLAIASGEQKETVPARRRRCSMAQMDEMMREATKPVFDPFLLNERHSNTSAVYPLYRRNSYTDY